VERINEPIAASRRGDAVEYFMAKVVRLPAEFVAEAKKGNFELDPVAGEELEKIVNGFFKADPATVNRLRELLK
jgi:hypothetical protein